MGNTQKDKQQFVEDLKKEWNIKDKKKEISQSLKKERSHLIDKSKSVKYPITVKELRRLRSLKLSKIKQDLFLKYFDNSHNVVRAAHKLGVSKQAIYDTFDKVPKFKQAYIELKDKITSCVEENLLDQALSPDMRSINAVKFYLEHNDDKYKRNSEIQVNTQINFEPDGQVKSILSRILPNNDD